MNFRQATALYETWLQQRIPLLAADLDLKHDRMKVTAFGFLRATFYRWAQVFPEVCAELLAGQLRCHPFGCKTPKAAWFGA